MVKVQASTLIARPAEDIFDFIAVDFFNNYKRWSPQVVSLRRISEGPVGLGTTVRQVRIDMGHRTESTFRVSAFDTGRRVDFKGVSDPYLISYRVNGLAEKTQLTFTFELSRLQFHMRPFRRPFTVAAQRSAKQVVRNIKHLLEA